MSLRTMLVITILVLLAVLAGWLTFSKTESKATITIDTQEAKEDAGRAVETGRDLFEKAKENTMEVLDGKGTAE